MKKQGLEEESRGWGRHVARKVAERMESVIRVLKSSFGKRVNMANR